MSLIAAPFAILAILYAGGFLAQLLGNYATWKQGGGIPGDGTSPLAASPDFLLCLSSVLRPPYGVYGILICIGLLAVLLIMVMRMGYGDAGEYDEDRNFSYSAKGTYGTSGWMSRKEMSGVLDLVPDLRKHKGVVLGMLDGKAVCIAVSSKSKQLGTWRISNYTPEFRETSGVGKRPVLTPDEVLRLPLDQALIIIRGKKVLQVDKMDYSKHPEAKYLRSCKASAHVPEWRRLEEEAAKTPQPAPKPAPAAKKPAKRKATKPASPIDKSPKEAPAPKSAGTPEGIITTDKDSILS